MWTTRQILATLSMVAVLGAVPTLGATEGPASDVLFDDRVVHDIRVSMHSADWARLRETYMTDTYYPADVSWDGHVVRNAGIRSRGFGSRDARKPGLKLDFNRYVSGQELAGLKGVVLDNFRQDPAMLKETVSMRLFARMGLVTPRAVHARVFVNDEYLGLFAAIELVDKSFLRSTVGEDDGYLYDFEWDGEYRLTWLGHDPRAYASMFKPETHETQPPEHVFGTLVEMITAVNRTSRDAWPQVLPRFFDVEHLMAYVAVESFLSDHDGLAGDWGINNFYLYRYAESERFVFIPWDKDVNFREPGRDVEAGFEGNVLLGDGPWLLAVRGRLPRGAAAVRRDRGTDLRRWPWLARGGGWASGGDDSHGRPGGPEQGLFGRAVRAGSGVDAGLRATAQRTGVPAGRRGAVTGARCRCTSIRRREPFWGGTWREEPRRCSYSKYVAAMRAAAVQEGGR